MKKISAILLAMFMVMSLLAVPSFAEGEIVIDATKDVVSFYDNGLNGGNGRMETLNGKLMLRQVYEWAAYDISEVPEGTYAITISYASTAQISLKNVGLEWIVDGGAQTRAYVAPSGKSWSDPFVTADAGKIFVSEDSTELKVKNIGFYPINLATITLTYESAENTVEDIKIYGHNITCQPNAASTGADSILGEDYWDVATSETQTNEFTRLGSDGLYHYPPTSGKIMEGAAYVHHTGDWSNYNISDFKAGTYEVILNRAHKVNANYKIKVDGADALTATLTKTADSYGVYADGNMGKIYIPEGAEKLTVHNMGTGSVYISYITLKYVSDERAPETYPTFSVNANDVIPGGQGVGFYANSMNGTQYENRLETSNASTVLRQAGEWVAYDISGVEPGIYSLDIHYTVRETTFYLDVYVDGTLQAVANPPKTGTGLGTAAEATSICDVEITEGAKVLKLRNSSNSVTFMQKVTLTYKGKTTDEVYKIVHNADHATRRDKDGAVFMESGVDFYDADGKTSLMMENNRLALNKGDWVRYDIKGIKPGTYMLETKYASLADARLEIKLDGEVAMTPSLDATDETGASYNYNVETGLDLIYIAEGTEYIIIKNNGPGSVYLTYVALTFEDAEEIAFRRISLKGNNVIPGGEGVGFHDTSGKGAIEPANGTGVAFRKDEWLKYDVSELAEGTYNISLLQSSTSNPRVKVYVDDEIGLLISVPATGGYGIYEEAYLGAIYIGEDTETITIESIGDANMYLEDVIFDFYTSSKEDYMDINISSPDVYQPDGFIEENVSFYDAGGASKFETSGSGIVLRTGDWYRYDLSNIGLKPGVYSVEAYGSITANKSLKLSVEADSTGEVRSSLANGTGGAETYTVGNIIVSEDSQYFTISAGAVDRIILYSLRITNAYEETNVDVAKDADAFDVVSSLKGLETAYAKVSLVRPESDSFNETVYIGIYEGGKLVDVIVDAAKGAYDYTRIYPLENLNENSVVKVFVWENGTNVPTIAENILSAQ